MKEITLTMQEVIDADSCYDPDEVSLLWRACFDNDDDVTLEQVVNGETWPKNIIWVLLMIICSPREAAMFASSVAARVARVNSWRANSWRAKHTINAAEYSMQASDRGYGRNAATLAYSAANSSIKAILGNRFGVLPRWMEQPWRCERNTEEEWQIGRIVEILNERKDD